MYFRKGFLSLVVLVLCLFLLLGAEIAHSQSDDVPLTAYRSLQNVGARLPDALASLGLFGPENKPGETRQSQLQDTRNLLLRQDLHYGRPQTSMVPVYVEVEKPQPTEGARTRRRGKGSRYEPPKLAGKAEVRESGPRVRIGLLSLAKTHESVAEWKQKARADAEKPARERSISRDVLQENIVNRVRVSYSVQPRFENKTFQGFPATIFVRRQVGQTFRKIALKKRRNQEGRERNAGDLNALIDIDRPTEVRALLEFQAGPHIYFGVEIKTTNPDILGSGKGRVADEALIDRVLDVVAGLLKEEFESEDDGYWAWTLRYAVQAEENKSRIDEIRLQLDTLAKERDEKREEWLELMIDSLQSALPGDAGTILGRRAVTMRKKKREELLADLKEKHDEQAALIQEAEKRMSEQLDMVESQLGKSGNRRSQLSDKLGQLTVRQIVVKIELYDAAQWYQPTELPNLLQEVEDLLKESPADPTEPKRQFLEWMRARWLLARAGQLDDQVRLQRASPVPYQPNDPTVLAARRARQDALLRLRDILKTDPDNPAVRLTLKQLESAWLRRIAAKLEVEKRASLGSFNQYLANRGYDPRDTSGWWQGFKDWLGYAWGAGPITTLMAIPGGPLPHGLDSLFPDFRWPGASVPGSMAEKTDRVLTLNAKHQIAMFAIMRLHRNGVLLSEMLEVVGDPEKVAEKMMLKNGVGGRLSPAKARQLARDIQQTFSELDDLLLLATAVRSAGSNGSGGSTLPESPRPSGPAFPGGPGPSGGGAGAPAFPGTPGGVGGGAGSAPGPRAPTVHPAPALDPMDAFNQALAESHYETIDAEQSWAEFIGDALSPRHLFTMAIPSAVMVQSGGKVVWMARSKHIKELVQAGGKAEPVREVFVTSLRFEKVGEWFSRGPLRQRVKNMLTGSFIADQQVVEKLKGIDWLVNAGSRLVATMVILVGGIHAAEIHGGPHAALLVQALAELSAHEIAYDVLSRSGTPLRKLIGEVDEFGLLLVKKQARMENLRHALDDLNAMASKPATETVSASSKKTQSIVNARLTSITDSVGHVSSVSDTVEEGLDRAFAGVVRALRKGDLEEARRALDSAKGFMERMQSRVDDLKIKLDEAKDLLRRAQERANQAIRPPKTSHRPLQSLNDEGVPPRFAFDEYYAHQSSGIGRNLELADEAFQKGDLARAARKYRSARRWAHKHGEEDLVKLIDKRLALSGGAEEAAAILARMQKRTLPITADEPIPDGEVKSLIEALHGGRRIKEFSGGRNPIFEITDHKGRRYILKQISDPDELNAELAASALARELGIKTPAARRVRMGKVKAVVEENGQKVTRKITAEGVLYRHIDGEKVGNLTEPVAAAMKAEYARQRVLRAWLADPDIQFNNLLLGGDARLWALDFGRGNLTRKQLMKLSRNPEVPELSPQEYLDFILSIPHRPNYRNHHAQYAWMARMDEMIHYSEMMDTIQAIHKLAGGDGREGSAERAAVRFLFPFLPTGNRLTINRWNRFLCRRQRLHNVHSGRSGFLADSGGAFRDIAHLGLVYRPECGRRGHRNRQAVDGQGGSHVAGGSGGQ